VKVDVRVIATTNRDLATEIAAGRFREDLFYRLAVVPIRIPALRDRPTDIAPLAEFFLQRYSQNLGRGVPTLSASALAHLQAWHWPGNIRELENAMQRAVLMCDGQRIDIEDIELDMPLSMPPPQGVKTTGGTNIAKPEQNLRDIESVEREHILKVLTEVGGNRKQAIAILGLSERALRYKLKSYKENGIPMDFDVA
jgi:two-component system response regulator FlrC